jgi:hypothetical protein
MIKTLTDEQRIREALDAEKRKGKNMIANADYWMGREKQFPHDYTNLIMINGNRTVLLINVLLSMFYADTGITLNKVTSGWRPLTVNSNTANAAEHSHHIDAQACDIHDTPNRDLARWCAKNQARLEKVGLWCERFEWTPDWVHLQPIPVPSGRRFFIPSSAPPKCARLPEQDQFHC